MNNLLDIITDLQDKHIDPKITVLPSTTKYRRTMKLRGNKTTA